MGEHSTNSALSVYTPAALHVDEDNGNGRYLTQSATKLHLKEDNSNGHYLTQSATKLPFKNLTRSNLTQYTDLRMKTVSESKRNLTEDKVMKEKDIKIQNALQKNSKNVHNMTDNKTAKEEGIKAQHKPENNSGNVRNLTEHRIREKEISGRNLTENEATQTEKQRKRNLPSKVILVSYSRYYFNITLKFIYVMPYRERFVKMLITSLEKGGYFLAALVCLFVCLWTILLKPL